MNTALVQDAEELAINVLGFLASQVGIATLAEVIDVLTGNSEKILAEAISQLVGLLAGDALNVLGPEKTKAAVQALFVAADKIVDAAENAKFPR